FVRATIAYVDGGGNFGMATSDPAHVMVGAANANTLNGGADDDIIYGLGGNDTINGGTGNDIIFGGGGADNLNGNARDDGFIYVIGDGGDSINGGVGNDTLRIFGSAANDTLKVTFDGSVITAFNGVGATAVEFITADLGGVSDTLDYGVTTAGVGVNLAFGV